VNDARPLPTGTPDTPEAMEARMRATRAAIRGHVAAAAVQARERTRGWPLWLIGSAAVAGLAIGLAGRSRPAPAPVRATASASSAARAAFIAGWAMRLAPLARRLAPLARSWLRRHGG
jgi:hypothetical protein